MQEQQYDPLLMLQNLKVAHLQLWVAHLQLKFPTGVVCVCVHMCLPKDWIQAEYKGKLLVNHLRFCSWKNKDHSDLCKSYQTVTGSFLWKREIESNRCKIQLMVLNGTIQIVEWWMWPGTVWNLEVSDRVYFEFWGSLLNLTGVSRIPCTENRD